MKRKTIIFLFCMMISSVFAQQNIDNVQYVEELDNLKRENEELKKLIYDDAAITINGKQVHVKGLLSGFSLAYIKLNAVVSKMRENANYVEITGEDLLKYKYENLASDSFKVEIKDNMSEQVNNNPGNYSGYFPITVIVLLVLILFCCLIILYRSFFYTGNESDMCYYSDKIIQILQSEFNEFNKKLPSEISDMKDYQNHNFGLLKKLFKDEISSLEKLIEKNNKDDDSIHFIEEENYITETKGKSQEKNAIIEDKENQGVLESIEKKRSKTMSEEKIEKGEMYSIVNKGNEDNLSPFLDKVKDLGLTCTIIEEEYSENEESVKFTVKVDE